MQDDGKIITVFTRSFQGSVLLFKYGQSMISESSLCNLGDQGNVNVIKDFGVRADFRLSANPLFQQCVLLAEHSIATTLIPGKLPP